MSGGLNRRIADQLEALRQRDRFRQRRIVEPAGRGVRGLLVATASIFAATTIWVWRRILACVPGRARLALLPRR